MIQIIDRRTGKTAMIGKALQTTTKGIIFQEKGKSGSEFFPFNSPRWQIVMPK